jgi:hypothetical protein
MGPTIEPILMIAPPSEPMSLTASCVVSSRPTTFRFNCFWKVNSSHYSVRASLAVGIVYDDRSPFGGQVFGDPIPLEAPVTTATLPLSLFMTVLLSTNLSALAPQPPHGIVEAPGRRCDC